MKTVIPFACIVLFVAHRAWAVMGFGDVVIVAANPAQEAMWATEELPKWVEMIDTANAQLTKTREMVDLVGHPERIASTVLEGAMPAVTLAVSANQLQESRDLVNFTQSSWNLYQNSHALSSDTLAVPGTVQVLGETVNRDRTRYLAMATEKALRNRLELAVKNKHDVDTAELNLQQRTLTRLSSATTQSEVSLHQAALQASKQRMDVADARVKQAQTELNDFVGNNELENRKNAEMQSETSEQFLTRVLQHAQDAVDVGVTSPTAPVAP